MDFLILLSIIAKLTLYIGALFASGIIIYQILFETNKTKYSFNSSQMIGAFALIGLITAIANYALLSARLVGDIAGTFDSEMLVILWRAPVGTALLLRVTGFAVIIVGLCWRKMGKSLMFIGCLVVIGSFTQASHVADIGSILSPILLLVHLIGISIWVGILLPLYKLSSNPAQITVAAEIAYSFGRFAVFFVPILLIAGGWLAYQLVGSLANLLTASYGQTLIVKVVIVGGLLMLAAANKLRFAPALRAGDSTALQRLKRIVLAEIVLVAFILAATAALTSAIALPENN